MNGARRKHRHLQHGRKTTMSAKKAFIMLATTAALGALGAAAAVAKDDMDNRGERGGSVVPCSLSGVNPAMHPDIFGDPAVAARQYGFVQSRDGTWHVQDNCSTRSLNPPEYIRR
jgi:hypothetical protein